MECSFDAVDSGVGSVVLCSKELRSCLDLDGSSHVRGRVAKRGLARSLYVARSIRQALLWRFVSEPLLTCKREPSAHVQLVLSGDDQELERLHTDYLS